MEKLQFEALEQFIIHAKKTTYVGGGQKLLSYRLDSKDLQFFDGDWAYHDSYVGENDFMGEEVVYYQKTAVWGMNYFGYILKSENILSTQAGEVIMKSLSAMYSEGRFLGGFEYQVDPFTYVDTNTGNLCRFRGKEQISCNNEVVYELVYHGGLIRS